MTQYDNEFFRGPPEESPTLATDQRPTGAEVFQAKPEKTTASADVPVTREEVPKDPPKKKSNARRITKAIKLLASCMAAVVITEAAVNMAATIEPPEVPTGAYYAGQWPGVSASHNGVYVMERDADLGYSIQMPLGEDVWRLTADRDWRMCWYEGTDSGLNMAYFSLMNLETGVSLMADLTAEPHYTEYEEDCYTTVTTSTGETLYIRAFFMSLGKYGEEYGVDESMLAESAELRQALLDETFAGIQVTPGTEDGWQAFQIGDHLYSQQGPDWYGLGGFGDLEIHIPWVNYAADYNLQNMTPYARETVNGITWSIYFAENDTYLWAVPNIDPEICLGGYVSRFMCADAQRRGEYIDDDEWLEMGGFTSASQRQTAVDILIECLQHHYALRDRWYPRDWPWKGPTDDHATLWIWAESLKGTWTQFSFGDEAYRVNSTDPELRFYWEVTTPLRDGVKAGLEISRMVQNDEVYAIDLSVCRTPFDVARENCAYRTARASGGETLYLEFRSQRHGGGPDFTSAEMETIADQILNAITFQSNPDDSGWCPLLLCDTMHSPANMEWSGCGIVGSNVEIRYIHEIQVEGLENETPCATRNHNGITWSFYYDLGDEEYDTIIWAVPDIEPDVCLGINAESACDYYRQKYPGMVTDGWNSQYNVPADDVSHAVEAMSEALAYIYPLGVEPMEGWYIPDWPEIGQITADHSYHLMSYSKYGTYAQFSLGDASYRLDSKNSHLCFFWNETAEVDGVMQADIHINHMTNNRRDWRVELLVQSEPFVEPRDEETEIDATVPVSDGSYLYLRFRRTWYDGNTEPAYDVFSGWVQTVMNAITASPADPNGWGQVWICDLMTTPLSENWDGNAMVTEDYEIPYFNRAEEQGLWDLQPYSVWEYNDISWTFIYEEEDDIIWALPDFDLRPDSQWCIGAPARDMAAFASVVDVDTLDVGEYRAAAVEGLAEGLSKYYPRREFMIEPGMSEPEYDVGVVLDHSHTNPMQVSMGDRGYRIGSSVDGAWIHWWNTLLLGTDVVAQLEVYDAASGLSLSVHLSGSPLDESDYLAHGQIPIDSGGSLYWYCSNVMTGDESQAGVFMGTFTASAAEDGGWGRVLIDDSLYTQQGMTWSGIEEVRTDGGRTVMIANFERPFPRELETQTPIAQREINGILWTLYACEYEAADGWPFIWAVPDVDPRLAIGSDYENAVYKYYEDNGLTDDFDGDIWTEESKNGAAEVIFKVLHNYYPQ